MNAEFKDFIYWWLAGLIAAATIAGGRIGLFLFRLAPDPPDDPVLAAHWLRRRRWLVWSELSALPAFATISVSSVRYWHLEPAAAVLIAMALGGVGFVLLVDGAQWMFRRRIGMPATEDVR